MFNKLTKSLIGVAAVWTLSVPLPAAAQNSAWTPLNYIEPGTSIPVRTTQTIDSSTQDGLIYTGTIDQDINGAQPFPCAVGSSSAFVDG